MCRAFVRWMSRQPTWARVVVYIVLPIVALLAFLAILGSVARKDDS